VIAQARVEILKAVNLPTSISDDDPRVKALHPHFKAQLRGKSKDMLIEEEVRRRKCVIHACDTFMRSTSQPGQSK
jgi:DnaJ family protein C protein 8